MAVRPLATLVGREAERERLEAFLGEVEQGSGSLCLEGEPGIGKSALWRTGVARAEELGFRVPVARPSASEQGLSYAGLADLLRSAGGEIGRLPAPQRRALRVALLLEEPSGDPPDERSISAATFELLRRLADASPVLIAVDDLQWLDSASARVLEFVLRRLDRERVGVLATARKGGAQALADLQGAELVEVGPLPLQALGRIFEERLGARFLRPTLHQLERTSGGNPFYALELAAALVRSGHAIVPGEPLPIPSSLRDLLGERLARLSNPGRRAALAAASLAQPNEAVLRRVTGAAGVADAVDAGVLVREGALVRIAHPLLAAALQEDESAGELRRLHRRLARLVREPEERALHLAAAADGADEAGAAALEVAAASVAARGASDAAIRLARRAYELTPAARSEAAHRRRLAWGRYVLAAGDPRHAVGLLQEQLEQTTGAKRRAEVGLELGRARYAIGASRAARPAFEDALGELRRGSASALKAELWLELAVLDIDDWLLESDSFQRGLELAERVGTPALLARALAIYAFALDLRGVLQSKRYWQRALEVEKASGELRVDGPTSVYGAQLAFFEDRGAGVALMESVAASMRRRFDPYLPEQLLRMSDFERNVGNWDQADRYIAEAADVIAQTGRDGVVPQCLLYEGRMAMLRGNFDDATATVNEALQLLDGRRQIEFEGLANSILERIAVQSGRFDEAHERLTAVLTPWRRIAFSPLLAETLAEAVALFVSLGDLVAAEQALDELAAITTEIAHPSFDALTTRSRGLVAASAGDPEAGIAELELAVAQLDALPSPWPYELARTLLLLGTAQRRARQKLAARTSLERALEIFDSLGARRWADKTRTELRQIGGRAGRSGRLTETERLIAELVATGRSNAETARELSLSPKTVEWNLSKVYRKLHVRSRTELAAKLARAPISA